MSLAEGDLFAGFTVRRLLGSRGTGEVYLVQRLDPPREEALTILPANAADEAGFRERFDAHADLAAGLSHPYIVGVQDHGEHEGLLWISTDYVDGTDAAELLAEKPTGLEVDDVVQIVAAIADALDLAHGHGLLHGDVKPANVLTTAGEAEQRRILLTDLGIARLNDVSALTATYAAPEQLAGGEITGAADQYALAATAHQLLTGSPPSSERRPELAALDSVLARALATSPTDRFATCRDFSAALSEAAAGAPSPVSDEPAQEATPPPVEAPAVEETQSAVAEEPEPVTPPEPWPDEEPRRHALTAPMILVTLLIATGIFAIVATGVRILGADGPPDWQPYVEAGAQGAIRLTTVDHGTVDADVQRILDNGTGKFYDDFSSNAASFKDDVRVKKSVSKGIVTEAGLESLDGDTARVLAGVTVKTTTAGQPAQDARNWRMRVTVVRVDGDYKVSDVEYVK